MYHIWKSHNVFSLRYGARQTEYLVTLDHFLSFNLTNNLKNQNSEQTKKASGDIILHQCSENRDHMIYCSWDMAREGCSLFFILGYFLLFYLPPPPPNSPKKQNSQNIIKPGDIIILHICTENYDHVMYSSWDMVRKGQTDSWCPRIFFLIFVAFIGLVIKHAPLI